MFHKSLALLLALVCGGCATYVATSGGVLVRDDSAGTKFQFSERDRSTVVEYYHRQRSQNNSSRPAKRTTSPGLAKREVLPPGLEGRSLPRDLESRLRVLPPTYVRLLVGRDLVLMERNTRVLQDILYGVAD